VYNIITLVYQSPALKPNGSESEETWEGIWWEIEGSVIDDGWAFFNSNKHAK